MRPVTDWAGLCLAFAFAVAILIPLCVPDGTGDLEELDVIRGYSELPRWAEGLLDVRVTGRVTSGDTAARSPMGAEGPEAGLA